MSEAASAPVAQLVYDETRDPRLMSHLNTIDRSVSLDDVGSEDGRLLLPPPARLDIIDVEGTRRALSSGGG